MHFALGGMELWSLHILMQLPFTVHVILKWKDGELKERKVQ